MLVKVLNCPFNVTIPEQLKGFLVDLLRRSSLARAVIYRVDLLAVKA